MASGGGAAGGEAIKPKIKLQCGQSMGQMPAEGVAVDAGTCGWRTVNAARFKMRIGPRYSKEKKKAPSTAAMFETLSCDLYSAEMVVSQLSELHDLPTPTVLSPHPDVPSLFCSNVIIPTAEPKMFGNPADGPSVHVFQVCQLTQQTADYLKDLHTAPNAVKLFVRWCQTAPNNEGREPDVANAMAGRMKVMAAVGNWDEAGLPGMLKTYNAKPVIINKSGICRVDRRKEQGGKGGYIEQIVNIHLFGVLARKGLHQAKSKTAQLEFAMAATIESKEDGEMPEIAIFATEFYRLPLFKDAHKLTPEALSWIRKEVERENAA